MSFASWAFVRGDGYCVICPNVDGPSGKISPVGEQDCKVVFEVVVNREAEKLPRRQPDLGDREYAGGAALAAARKIAEVYGVAPKPPDYEAEMASLRTKLADADRELWAKVNERRETPLEKMDRKLMGDIDEQVIAPNPSDQPQTPPTDNPALEAGPQSVVKPKRARKAT